MRPVDADEIIRETDAIPVEWIKEWLRRRPLYEDSACDMLEDWRKENEQSDN